MFCIKCGKENEEGNAFCMYCGEKLEVPETEVVSEDAAPPETEVVEKIDLNDETDIVAEDPQESNTLDAIQEEPQQFSQGAKESKPDSSEAVSHEKQSDPSFFQKNRVPILAGGGCLLVVLVVVIILAGTFVSRGVLFAGNDNILYFVSEDLDSYQVEEVWIINSNGDNNRKLVSEKSGLYANSLDLLSPDKKLLYYFTGENELYLLNIDDEDTMYLGDRISWRTKFSSDSKFLGFSEVDGDDMELVVVDSKGDQIIRERDLIFFEFLPNPDKVLVSEYDVDDSAIVSLGVLDVNSGKFDELTDIDGDDINIIPVLSTDGKFVYYSENEDLIKVEISNGRTDFVHEFESDSGSQYIGVFSETNFMTVFDSRELYLMNTKDDSVERIAGDVISPETIKVSPDGKFLAYVASDGGSVELMVYEIRSGEATRIDKGESFYFTFTPDGKHIIYIEYDGSIGDLYSSAIDGSDRVRLDRDVGTFTIASKSNYIYYTLVDDNPSDPETEIFKIRIDGEKKEKILNSAEGLIQIVNWE